MVNLLIPYVAFPGNCREALNFYTTCLGGEITLMQTFAESPLNVPEAFGQRVFNAEFRVDEVFFRASDTLPPHELIQGTNFSLFVAFSEKAAQEEAYALLSEGGEVVMPLRGNFGMLRDRYQIQWMLVHSAE